MSDFKELILKHRGKVFAIIGGAPFDADALKGIKADVWISVNEHGVKVRECDYIVAMDEEHTATKMPMLNHLRQFAPNEAVIGPQSWADYQFTSWPDAPRRSFLSGMAAVWCAWLMGAKAIVLVGMNAYEGKEGAMRDARLVSGIVSVPVRSIDGGALESVFPEYDPKERFGHYKESPEIGALLTKQVSEQITVIVVKPTTIRNGEKERTIGERVTGMPHEFARLIRCGMLKEVT